MNGIFYTVYGTVKLMAAFDDYTDCKKAFEAVRVNHPDGNVFIDKISPISFEEFMDKTKGGTIPEWKNK